MTQHPVRTVVTVANVNGKAKLLVSSILYALLYSSSSSTVQTTVYYVLYVRGGVEKHRGLW